MVEIARSFKSDVNSEPPTASDALPNMTKGEAANVITRAKHEAWQASSALRTSMK